MEQTYLKGKGSVIRDALSHVIPLEPGVADKDDFDTIPVHYITSEVSATESQLERVRLTMEAAPLLSQLKHQIFQGWPDSRRSIPESIHPFWTYRDELVVEEGLIFKAHKLVIPASQKHTFLKDLHVGHLGEEKTPNHSPRKCILARHKREHQRIHQWLQHMPVDKIQPIKGTSHSI